MVIESQTATMKPHDKLVDQFKKEVEAYWAYKEVCKASDDFELKLALKEIMYDEYLHARYLRRYLKDNNLFKGPDIEEFDRKFHMIEDD